MNTNEITLLQTLDALIPADDPNCFSNDIRNLLLMLEMPMTRELLPTLMPLDAPNDPAFADLDEIAQTALRAAYDAIAATISNEWKRHELTETLLAFSLCPLHAIDFAICFDDDDADCAPIRLIFPNTHDT
jgi:hypothetical protein